MGPCAFSVCLYPGGSHVYFISPELSFSRGMARQIGCLSCCHSSVVEASPPLLSRLPTSPLTHPSLTAPPVISLLCSSLFFLSHSSHVSVFTVSFFVYKLPLCLYLSVYICFTASLRSIQKLAVVRRGFVPPAKGRGFGFKELGLVLLYFSPSLIKVQTVDKNGVRS